MLTPARYAACWRLIARSDTSITQSIKTMMIAGTMKTFIPIDRRLSMVG